MDKFEQLEEEKVVVTGVAEEPKVENAKAAETKKKKESFLTKVKTEEGFKASLHTLSDSLEVVKALSFGATGSVIIDEEAKAEDKRVLIPTSGIVGYKVANVGETPIPYTVEEYVQDAEGKFIGTQVDKVIAAGGTADIPKKYMTLLCSRKEISFALKNGKIIRSSRKDIKSVDDELCAYHFKPSDDNVHINSDEMKQNISEQVTLEDGSTVFVVTPEFAGTFGYLNNATKGKKDPKVAGTKFTSQDWAANYIQELIANSGM